MNARAACAPLDAPMQVERLARGLAHERNLRVVALNGDPPEARLFARQVLNASFFPSVVSMPRKSRTFYTFKRGSADANSLLRFANMTCRGREESLYALREAGATAVMAPVSGVHGTMHAAMHAQ